MASRTRRLPTRIDAMPSIGKPVAVSSLAMILLRMHSRPILHLVTTNPNDTSGTARGTVSALEQRQV